MSKLNIDRVQGFVAKWKAVAPETPDVLVAVVGAAANGFENKRNAAVVRYLFPGNNETPNTLVALRRSDAAVFLVHAKGTEILVDADQAQTITLTVKCYDEDKEATAAALLAFVGESAMAGGPAAEFGDLRSPFAEEVYKVVSAKLNGDHVKSLSSILYSKANDELINIKKAGALARAPVTKYVTPYLVGVFEGAEKPKSKQELSNTVGDMLAVPNKIPGLESMAVAGFAPAIQPPLIQSGNNYTLDLVQEEQDAALVTLDCNIVASGACFNGYTSYVARTYLFPPACGEAIVGQYDFALQVQAKVFELLVPGTKLSDVFAQTMAFAKELNADFATKLENSFGFSTGMLLNEAALRINEKSEAIVEASTAFVVRVAMNDLEPFSPEGLAAPTSTKCAVLLADTVIVGAEEIQLATNMKKETNEITFRLAEPEEEVEVIKPVTRAAAGTNVGVSRVYEVKDQLLQLLDEKHEAWIQNGGKEGNQKTAEDITATELGRLAHGDLNELGMKSALAVDEGRQAVWLPIGDEVVPFHVSTINKAEVKPFGTTSHALTLNFHATQEANPAFRTNRTQSFIREITIQNPVKAPLDDCAARVVHIMNAIKTRDTQRKQNHGVVEQSIRALKQNATGAAPRLKNVKCKPPPITGRGVGNAAGDLEGHTNGFRFNYHGGEPLVIMYDNIRMCIFQPAEKDANTVFHIILKNPMLVNKKKTSELQFYAEVIDTSEAVRITRRTHEEEMEADRREEERLKNTSAEFILFCRNMEKTVTQFGQRVQMSHQLKKDESITFQANTGRSMANVHGNDKALWAVGETPFWTVILDDIEAISLERVAPGNGTWDMKFLNKDYRRVHELSTISSSQLDIVKQLLIQCKVIFFESAINLNWNNLLKEIRDDEDWEPYGEHGWRTYIDSDDDDEDEDAEEEDSEDFDSEDDDESDDSDYSEDSDDAEEVTDSSDISTESTGSADSWDRMERKAEEDDRRRGRDDSDSDSDAPRRKKGRSAPARAPARPAAKKAAPAPGAYAPKQAAPKVAYGAKRPPMGAMPPKRPM